MRCYTFGNFYMSSIQQGIQGAHSIVELFNKYTLYTDGSLDINKINAKLFDWSINHKTMICLNAGAYKQLREIEAMMDTPENVYPWSVFSEDHDSLGGILTNVAIVLPEKIYDTAEKIRSGIYYFDGLEVFERPQIEDSKANLLVYREPTRIMEFNQFEKDLINKLNSCQLAR